MSRRTRRRAQYTRANDITVKDAATGETVGYQRRYSPSELNAVRSGRNPELVRKIARRKQGDQLNRAVTRYLEIVNTDN